jgi:hypothetical protein
MNPKNLLAMFATRDAQQRAMSFVISQSQRIEREVYEMRYMDLMYSQLLPIDTAGPEWLVGITYFSMDAVGAAAWFTGKADDVRHVGLTRDKMETTVAMAAIGYDYDLEEVGIAMTMGMDVRNDKANMARRGAEEFIDKVAMLGDTTKGYTGLANNANVTAALAPATGTGATTTWSTKTADNILADINGMLTGQATGTFGAEMSDTLLIPYSRMMQISTMRIDQYNTQTVLSWIMENNIYTRQTGLPLTMRGVWTLDTAGAGSTPRLVAYRRDPSVVVMYMPMPFRFLPVWQQGPMKFEVPGIFRISGVEVKRPKAMRYMDGI